MGVQIPPGTPYIKTMEDFKSVSDIIDYTLKDAGLEKAVDLWKVYAVFKDIFKDGMIDNINVLGLRNGTLRLKVSSSVWAQELSFMEDGLINKINASLGSTAVKCIRIVEV